MSKVVRNITKTRKLKPKNKYRTFRDYDFLQNIRVIFKWALENHELTKGELETLLYLYPLGTFSNYEFHKYTKIISMYRKRLFNKFVKDGWILTWREKNSNQKALYALTNKAKILCNRLHKFCTGDMAIPETPTYNNLAKDGKRINTYYMDIIKKINKERNVK